jgi:hypothetical protein
MIQIVEDLGADRVAQVMKHLPSKHEALSSNSIPPKKMEAGMPIDICLARLRP